MKNKKKGLHISKIIKIGISINSKRFDKEGLQNWKM